MIREKIYYVTDDGSEFESRKEAEQYECLCEKCEKIMSQLRPRCDGPAVRQDAATVKKAYHEFLEFCATVIPSHKDLFLKTISGEAHPSWAERVLSESGFDCLTNASFRFMCTNMNSGIEYEQPYFVNHEKEWKGKIL